jgi:ABC-type phosphate/phosphonate transport system substrate-binding protein
MAVYRVGAVVYHPKVRSIWAAFEEWFSGHGVPLRTVYFEAYDEQVAALLAGDVDLAWNTNLAYAETLRATDGRATPMAMRDTDLGWRSHIVTTTTSDATGLADLKGARVGFGDADSPQAHLLPVHFLRAEGFDPGVDVRAERLDRDLGKHGDTGGAELAQLARLRIGELDAAVVSSVTLDAVRRLGDAEALRVVWTSPPYSHCNFTALDATDPRHAAFVEELLRMDASDPKMCEPMQLEYVNRWIRSDGSGYADLVSALSAGPVVVGDAPVVA